MKSTEKPDLEWPFVEAESDVEGPGHVRMKNTAVYFLLSIGYDVDQIETEYRMDSGWVDVVAVREDGSLVCIECETTDTVSRANISNTRMLEDGHQLFLLVASGLYQVAGRGYHFEPVDIQLSLSTSVGQLGRWYSDGRGPKIRNVHPHSREMKPPKDRLFETHKRHVDDPDRWKSD